MIPNPKLIPRFNIDYGLKDFVVALQHINQIPNTTTISNAFPEHSILFSNSGRTSLYLILKSLGLAKNSKIGIPLYSCPSNFDSIVNAGHIPVFLDIDLNDYTLDTNHLQENVDGLDAIVVIHTFGRPADMKQIKKIAGNIPIIEDCAHALMSRYDGKIVGTLTNVSYFSFRTGKYLSAGEGSMIVTQNSQLVTAIRRNLSDLPEPSSLDQLKNSIITLVRSTMYHAPFFGLVSLPFGSIVEKKVDIMNKLSFEPLKISNTDLSVICRKMHDFAGKVEIQRQKSYLLMELLKNSGLKLPEEKKGTYCNYFLFPLFVDGNLQRDNICKELSKNGIDSTKLFSSTPSIARKQYGYRGDCENTEKLTAGIFTVPNFYSLENNQLEHIADSLLLNL